MNDFPTVAPSTASEGYQFREWTEAPAITAAYVWPVVVELLHCLPEGASILDAGCGNGAFCAHLATGTYKVTGVDLSDSGIALAKARNSKALFFQKSLYDSFRDVKSDGFDAIVTLEVIEHLYDAKAFAANIAASLRPGGTLVLSTPYHGWLKNVVLAVSGKMDRHWHPERAGGHIKFWSRASITALLREEGLTVTHFRGGGRLPWLWKSMIILARKGS
ncbi:MAG: class I SAM-dependent methyltransferase [Planctomycetota bacterium]|nr:class I SAM-dependent methyltransferase [Planctomycetota bacterium]